MERNENIAQLQALQKRTGLSFDCQVTHHDLYTELELGSWVPISHIYNEPIKEFFEPPY